MWNQAFFENKFFCFVNVQKFKGPQFFFSKTHWRGNWSLLSIIFKFSWPWGWLNAAVQSEESFGKKSGFSLLEIFRITCFWLQKFNENVPFLLVVTETIDFCWINPLPRGKFSRQKLGSEPHPAWRTESPVSEPFGHFFCLYSYHTRV